MPDEAGELIQHIHEGLRDEVMGHLRIGWAMARLIELRAYEVDGTLARWVKRHLPISLRTAELHHKNWQITRKMIEADSGPILPEAMLNWVVVAQRVALTQPILPSDKALSAMSRLLKCESETIAKVWDRAETIAQEAGETQIKAPHVHKATAEVIAPPPAADGTPEAPEAPEADSEPPEPVETEEQVRHRRAMAMIPDDCEDTELIPEVAAAMCDRETLHKLARDCQTIRNHLRQLEDKECTAYLHVDEARSFLQSASRKIRAAAAWAPCPYCHQTGRKRKNCLVCKPPAPSTRKSLGWVPRLRYKMSPEQLKKAAEAAK
jgi:hypothetical protein